MTTITPRLFPAPGFSVDWQGRFTGKRQWHIDIPDASQARDYARTNAGIDVNMPFPGVPNLLADVINVEPDGVGVGNEITAIFSSDRRFGGSQNIDKDQPGYYSVDFSTQSVVRKTPANIKSTIAVSAAGSTTKKKVWTNEIHEIEEAAGYVVVNVSVQSWNMAKNNAVMAQVNHVHTIGGTQLRFKGSNTYMRRQAGSNTPAVYDVTYEWQVDPGTDPIDSPDISKFQIGDLTGRPPHWRYIVEPSDDPENTRHTITVYRAYKNDPNGYLSLPGMPPI
jgi:hypothetical protein